MLTFLKKLHINWPIILTVFALVLFVALVGGFVYWQVSGSLGNSSDSNQLFNNFEFTKTYDKPLIIKLTDLAFSISPLGAQPARAQTENNVVKYINAYADTDIVQTKSFNKIKEDIILKQPGHPEIFEYQIDLAPYDFVKDGSGNLIFYEKGKSGDEAYKRFTIPAPYLVDADNKKSSTSEVESNLSGDGRLTIKPSQKWLSQAKYPVVLDPTIEINIINVHSHPQQGENWTVDFTTQGTADLKIIPNDQATIDDDEFVSLSCNGETRTPQILADDVIFFPNWNCDKTATVIHYTKKAGNHTLRFEFLPADSGAEGGGQITYAYNTTYDPMIFRSSGVIFRSSGVIFRPQTTPTNLSLSHSTRSKSFSVSWTAGINNGGAGGCKLQFYTGSGWTDITSATSVNCDANSSSASYNLNADGWKASWGGTQIRILRISDSTAVGTFSQTLACTTTTGSDSATPTIDEDCNGYWDNTASYNCNPHNCNPHNCNPYNCNPYNCNPYNCNPYGCNWGCTQSGFFAHFWHMYSQNWTCTGGAWYEGEWCFPAPRPPCSFYYPTGYDIYVNVIDPNCCAYGYLSTCYDTCYDTCYETCYQTCYDTCYDTCYTYY